MAVASSLRRLRGKRLNGSGLHKTAMHGHLGQQHRRPKLPSISAADDQQLRAGRKVQRQERDGRTGWGFVVTDVSAPPSVVLGCLEAFSDYPKMIPVVRDVAVHSESRASNGALMVNCTYLVSRFRLGISVMHKAIRPAGLVRFDLDQARSGLVLQDCRGFWFVEHVPEEFPSRSRVWLYVQSLRTSAFLPHWLVDYAAERALNRATDWLRPQAERLWQQQLSKQEHLSGDGGEL